MFRYDGVICGESNDQDSAEGKNPAPFQIESCPCGTQTSILCKAECSFHCSASSNCIAMLEMLGLLVHKVLWVAATAVCQYWFTSSACLMT